MVLPASDGISRVPPYSGSTLRLWTFRLQGCYLLRPAFPDRFAYARRRVMSVLQPPTLKRTPGLGSSRFARRYSGNRVCFLFLRVLRCFSSPGLPSAPYGFRCGSRPFRAGGSPIRRSPDQRLLTAPRSISVFVPSFIGSRCQGIHRALLLT
jgi:hypothetical protein